MTSLFEIRDIEIVLTGVTRESSTFKDVITEKKVVPGVSLTVGAGEAVALVGESGSGKSLIAMGAVDLLTPGAYVVGGQTVFEGQVLQDLDELEWQRLVGLGIGVLLQDAVASWNPLDPVGQQSGEVLETHHDLSDKEVQERVVEALGEVQLPRKRAFRAFAFELSQGQAQRAMLAAALLSGPRLLIADEPLSGLDVTVARAILDLIDDMRRRRGMGMLLVTHDLGVVASVADRVAVVYGGMVVEVAPVMALFNNPQHPYTSGLLRSIPGLGTALHPIPGEAPDLMELSEGCRFADRCEFVIGDCRSALPELVSVGQTEVACIRATELDLPGIPSR